MLYFANPSTPDVRAAMSRGELGCIVTPAQRQAVPDGAAWCADNGCFGKGYPGDARWLSWLRTLPGDRSRCMFATAPDVVGDAAATLARSTPMLPLIRAAGYPAAFVAQDGLEDLPVPWEEFDVLFIGGSTAWKLGQHAAALTAEARRRGKPVHMGRVNSRMRARYALFLGCDSADGTFISRGPDKNLPLMLGWLSEIHNQGALL